MQKYLIFGLLFTFLPVHGGLYGNNGSPESKEIIYIGTFDTRGSKGLYVMEFDRNNLELIPLQTVDHRRSPNFQAINPGGDYLYSVSGHSFSGDKPFDTVSAYSINSNTGELTLINEQSAEGRGACHVSVDPKGKFIYVSNYSSGNLSVYEIREDGSLTEAVDVVQHKGSSVNQQRQEAPHVHSIIPSPDGRFIYASDLGIDKIMIYEVDRETGELSPADTPFVENTAGAGPRHFAMHPAGEFAYSAEELSSTVAVFRVNRSNGALTQIQRINMLPEDFDEENTAADIHISPDGKFLYATNRGHDSLVIYRIDNETGELSLVGHESTHGEHPRNFGIDKNGEYVFVANRDDDNVVFFQRDAANGELQNTGLEAHVPAAVCVTQLIMETE